MTDSELAARCRQGDRQAQRRLYEQCADRLYRLLFRMTGNTDDAFDLAQESFVRAFERIGTFDGSASLATWVYRIAVNEGLQFLRRRRVAGRAAPRIATNEEAPAGPSLEDRLDVADALDQLPELERTLIVLRYFEERSYADMAETLGKPPGTIASGLNRARQMLLEILGPGPTTRS